MTASKYNYKLAIVGATGLVGTTMLRVLGERGHRPELFLAASERSIGRSLKFQDRAFDILSIEKALESKPDFALFSAGGTLSELWAPRFAESGCVVIDNSSAWRMKPEVKLIVPEVNGSMLNASDLIIANPNCSTIQLVMILEPLRRVFGIGKVVVSTYQSITGTGQKAVEQMDAERSGSEVDAVYPYRIDRNLIPQCDLFLDNGYTKEEMKLTLETVKILGDANVQVTATAVRVPVTGGHSESVSIELGRDFDLREVRQVLEGFPGVCVLDSPELQEYPMPLLAEGKDEVFVGRMRKDLHSSRGLNLFITADNLRKGAATNAVQILEVMLGLKSN